MSDSSLLMPVRYLFLPVALPVYLLEGSQPLAAYHSLLTDPSSSSLSMGLPRLAS